MCFVLYCIVVDWLFKVPHIVCGVLCWSLLCYAFLCVISSFVIRDALIVFLMFCDCECSVALHHCAVGWSAVCDCGIS